MKYLFLLILFSSSAIAHPAFFVDEDDDGAYRICYYEDRFGRFAITISSMEFCPLTVEGRDD